MLAATTDKLHPWLGCHGAGILQEPLSTCRARSLSWACQQRNTWKWNTGRTSVNKARYASSEASRALARGFFDDIDTAMMVHMASLKPGTKVVVEALPTGLSENS